MTYLSRNKLENYKLSTCKRRIKSIFALNIHFIHISLPFTKKNNTKKYYIPAKVPYNLGQFKAEIGGSNSVLFPHSTLYR